ncbi:hypothetical protein [Acinetobacter sp. CE-15]|uniref:hypothetical protein n=1 Tax=Acinetobacter sp. CE-15 TaxID=3425693 RepID=UPI003DA3E077
MLILSQEKLYELDVEQNKEFLYDLVYEIIKENPALKLNGQFDQLLEPVQSLINLYIEKGINQIYTLKYMVKSHVYLGIDYANDPQYFWLQNEMQHYNIAEQVSYVDAFYTLLESYKSVVLGHDFKFVFKAIDQLNQSFSHSNLQENLSIIYPEKIEFLKQKDLLSSLQENYSNDIQSYKEYVLGKEFHHNVFIKNLINLEV